jgi:hypothetical protein
MAIREIDPVHHQWSWLVGPWPGEYGGDIDIGSIEVLNVKARVKKGYNTYIITVANRP